MKDRFRRKHHINAATQHILDNGTPIKIGSDSYMQGPPGRVLLDVEGKPVGRAPGQIVRFQ